MKSIIGKVIQRVDAEIEDYLGSNPAGDFTRNGKMGVEYNKDHFNLRINKKGKLNQFHTVESAFTKPMQPTTNTSAD